MSEGPFTRSKDAEVRQERRAWFNPTLSFDGFAAMIAVVFLIRWLAQLDGRVENNSNSIVKQDAQITKLSEAVTKLTIIAEINERREQDKASKK